VQVLAPEIYADSSMKAALMRRCWM